MSTRNGFRRVNDRYFQPSSRTTPDALMARLFLCRSPRTAVNGRSAQWFGTSPRRAIPEGHTTSITRTAPQSANPPSSTRATSCVRVHKLRPHYRTFFATTSRPAPCPASVLCRSQCAPLAVLPLAASQAGLPSAADRRYRGDRLSCSVPAPATSSRHLYTGHRQGSMQATPWLRARHHGAPLSRKLCAPPVLMPSFRLSMRQQWFTHVRLLVTHLTR